MKEFETFDRLLGLHDDITISYVVDGYRAEWTLDDGGEVLRAGEGETVLAALLDLSDKMEKAQSVAHIRVVPQAEIDQMKEFWDQG